MLILTARHPVVQINSALLCKSPGFTCPSHTYATHSQSERSTGAPSTIGLASTRSRSCRAHSVSCMQYFFIRPWQQMVRVSHLRRRSRLFLPLSSDVPRRDPSLERPQPNASHHLYGHRAEAYRGFLQGERNDEPQSQPSSVRQREAAHNCVSTRNKH